MRYSIVPLFCLCLGQAQVSVLTYHNDLARTGQNLNETTLTTDAVANSGFHKSFSHAVDGAVYAQPLYVPGVSIPGKGAHNVVYVATEHDSVYAFDADSTDGANTQPLWQTSFLSSGVTTVPAQNTNCGQIAPEIGITGTPVIDPNSGTLYVTAMTLENGNAYHQRLHALDITTGAERAGSPVDVQASGFVPKNYKGRPGLLLLNGVVYTSWSSHCDIGVYHGFIMAYDAKSLQQVATYSDTPNGNEGSFWSAGAAPAVDSSGNIFVISGNGSFDAKQGGTDLGESFIRLTPGLAVADYFTPFNQASLNGNDLDTGSSSALLLPDSAGTPQHPHLLVSAGKEGRIYLIDRDNMGHYQSGSDDQIPQSLPGALGGGLFGIPAYFNGTVYFSGAGDNLKAYAIRNGQLSTSPTSKSTAVFAYPGSVPSVSANGSNDGIVWVLETSAGGTLHGYDAANLGHELYNSSNNSADALGSYVKYSVPTVANAKVYAGTQNTLAAFGLTQAATPGGLAITNGASYATSVAPGSIVSLFGSFGVTAATSNSTPLPWNLATVSVRVNGMLAPLFYAGPNQINAQIPYETPVGQNTFVVSIAGRDWTSGTINAAATAPGMFTIAPGQAAVTNQDGSVNGSNRPAAAGSVITAYLTGQGAVQPAVATGAAAPLSPLSRPVGAVTATVAGQPADVMFAGLTPTLAGVFQVNLVVPQVPAGQQSIDINVGGVDSNPASIYVSAQ